MKPSLRAINLSETDPFEASLGYFQVEFQRCNYVLPRYWFASIDAFGCFWRLSVGSEHLKTPLMDSVSGHEGADFLIFTDLNSAVVSDEWLCGSAKMQTTSGAIRGHQGSSDIVILFIVTFMLKISIVRNSAEAVACFRPTIR